MTLRTDQTIITRPTGITWKWKSDAFCPDSSYRVCSKCETYLTLHNPTGKQILGYCSACKNNAIIETLK